MLNHFFIPDPTKWGPVDGLYLGDTRCLDRRSLADIKLTGNERIVWMDDTFTDIWAGHLTGCMEWASQMTPMHAMRVIGYNRKTTLYQFLLERLVVFHASGGAGQ